MSDNGNNTKYCISKDDEESDNGIPLLYTGRHKDPLDEFLDGIAPSQESPLKEPTPKPEAPKREKSETEKKQDELNRLHRLLYERDQDFEKAKGKRTIVSLLAFTAFYYLIFWLTGSPSGVEYLTNLLLALFIAGVHFWANITIFWQLFHKAEEETKILENIRKQISELEKELRKQK